MKLREIGVDLNLDFLYCMFWTEACERCEDLWKIRWHSSTLCFWFRNFHLNSSYCDIYTIHFLHGGNTINLKQKENVNSWLLYKWVKRCSKMNWNSSKWSEIDKKWSCVSEPRETLWILLFFVFFLWKTKTQAFSFEYLKFIFEEKNIISLISENKMF